MNFSNAGQSTLLSAALSGDLAITVVSATPFPAAPFHIVVDQELMTVTAVAGTTFTVTRGVEGTTAAAHAAGATVTNTVTAADYAGFGGTPSPLTTKGDLWGYDTGNNRVPVGADGLVLTADSTQAIGVKWKSGTGGGDRLATLANAPNLITNTNANLTYGTWNVVKATTTAVTVTLPAPSGNQLLGVRVDPSSTHLVTVSQHAAETIDGSATRIMWAGEKAELLTDGTNWYKVAGIALPMICRMSLSGAQSIPQNVVTQVLLDTTLVDNTGLMADTGNNRINCQRPGIYLVAGSDSWSAAAPSTQDMLVVYGQALPTTQLGKGGSQNQGNYASAGPAVPASVTMSGNDQRIFLSALQGNTAGNVPLRNDGVACSISVIEIPGW